jgi:hypothetical protein
VAIGYVAGTPSLATAVAEARGRGPDRAVAVATYLLAPSAFVDRLEGCGADRVGSPLAPHRRLTDLVLRRYDAARADRRPAATEPSHAPDAV